ncbi:MAG: FAD-dependent oxidoreductase [Nitrospirota bacterium]|nr:MAG: FAD-dependent oxidoreductase [Nitrospirota bacterium]
MKIILGAGLAGLSAGFDLTDHNESTLILEKGGDVGGLARTHSYNGFRFDLGGHRFITRDEEVETLVKELLAEECLDVPRKSAIYFKDRFFDYPLKPGNAVFGLGLSTTLKIIKDYLYERVKNVVSPSDIVSLEDWVVGRFGRKMFELYFKKYSEKVWGIDCSDISQEWVSQRISGLSLWQAAKKALFRFSGKGIDTLADRFIYPRTGIGEISERLKSRVLRTGEILTNAEVLKVRHSSWRIESVVFREGPDLIEEHADSVISTIPLDCMIRALDPAPPDDILHAISHLHYRDLIVVALMLDRSSVTDLNWLYLPESKIPVGRIHEPKNWSGLMAPEDKTHIVAEYFCFRNDPTWNSGDEILTGITLDTLEKLNFIGKGDYMDSCVVRVPRAYPLLDTTYRKYYELVLGYISKFDNLEIAGRGGTFQYLNMDHAIRSGLEAARRSRSADHMRCNNVIAAKEGLR